MRGYVLILVLVDFTLRLDPDRLNWHEFSECLNPCFSGLYTPTAEFCPEHLDPSRCLNPCFSGLYTPTAFKKHGDHYQWCLNPCFSGLYTPTPLGFTRY